MDYSEKWGRDVDEAVQLALDDLKVSIDEVNVRRNHHLWPWQ